MQPNPMYASMGMHAEREREILHHEPGTALTATRIGHGGLHLEFENHQQPAEARESERGRGLKSQKRPRERAREGGCEWEGGRVKE